MNRDIARVEKDLLFDISIVHSSNINDRIEWVLKNTNSNWIVPYIAVTSPASIVITPPFLIVSSLKIILLFVFLLLLIFISPFTHIPPFYSFFTYQEYPYNF